MPKEKLLVLNIIYCHRNGVALSDAIVEKSKHDPSVTPHLDYNLTMSRKEGIRIHQQPLGGTHLWGDTIDIVADIYSGVGICNELININLLTG